MMLVLNGQLLALLFSWPTDEKNALPPQAFTEVGRDPPQSLPPPLCFQRLAPRLSLTPRLSVGAASAEQPRVAQPNCERRIDLLHVALQPQLQPPWLRAYRVTI